LGELYGQYYKVENLEEPDKQWL